MAFGKKVVNNLFHIVALHLNVLLVQPIIKYLNRISITKAYPMDQFKAVAEMRGTSVSNE